MDGIKTTIKGNAEVGWQAVARQNRENNHPSQRSLNSFITLILYTPGFRLISITNGSQMRSLPLQSLDYRPPHRWLARFFLWHCSPSFPAPFGRRTICRDSARRQGQNDSNCCRCADSFSDLQDCPQPQKERGLTSISVEPRSDPPLPNRSIRFFLWMVMRHRCLKWAFGIHHCHSGSSAHEPF